MSAIGSRTFPTCLLILRPSLSKIWPRQRTVLYDDLYTGFNEEGENSSFIEELLGAGEDPGFLSTDNELIREALLKALAELPPEQREVFVRHELEQESFKEISDDIDVPINTLLSRKHYAVKFLRKRLTSLYKELFDDSIEQNKR